MKKTAMFLVGVALCLVVGVPSAQARRMLFAGAPISPSGAPILDQWAFLADSSGSVDTWDLGDTDYWSYDSVGTVSGTVANLAAVLHDPVRRQLVLGGVNKVEIQPLVSFPAAVSTVVTAGSVEVRDLAAAPDFSVYWVLTSDFSTTTEIKSIDPATGAVTGTLALTGGANQARQLLFTPAYGSAPNQLWVTYGTSNYHRIALTGLSLPAGPLAAVPMGTSVAHLALDPSGSRLIGVGGLSGGFIYPYSVDVQTGARTALNLVLGLPVYDEFSMVTVRPQGDYAYAVGNQFNSSNPGGFVIDLSSSAIVGQFPISTVNACTFGQVDPTGVLMITGNGSDNQFIDLATDPANPASLTLNRFTARPNVRRIAFGTPSRPHIERVCISGGTGVAGDPFRIEGSGFNPGTLSVTINGADILTLSEVTATSISGTLPAATPGYSDGHYNILVANGTSSLCGQVINNGYPVGDTAPFFAYTEHQGGTTQEDYRMLGLSAVVPAGAAKQALEAALGAYDPGQWRLFQWDASKQEYVEYPQLDDCDWTGQGFWLLSREPAAVLAAAFDPGIYSGPLNLSLQPGWNLVSSPFEGDIVNWLNVYAGPLPDNAGEQAAQYGISDPIYWDGTQYLSTTTLVAGQGYWVHNPHPRTFWISMYSDLYGGAIPETRPLGPDDPVPPPPPGAVQSRGSSAACGAGTTGSAGGLGALAVFGAFAVAASVRTFRA